MKHIRSLLPIFLAVTLLPTVVQSQALVNITSLFVAYSTRKNTVNPTGDLKARIDSVDRDLALASRRGQTGEVRRLLAKGTTLLAGRQWTDSAEFSNSLLLRTDRVVVESQQPYVVRLEQLYFPAAELLRPLSATALLMARSPQGTAAPSMSVVRTLGNYDGVSRDLRDSPLAMEFDLHDVPDGRYTLVLNVFDSTRAIGSTALAVMVQKGIEDKVRQLTAVAATAPEALRAEILYPVDRLRNVNRGRLELRTFDVVKDFATADSVVVAVKAKKDPFASRTGDMKRHYLLAAANEVMPYHLYVPTKYAASRPMPLIIALHGLGQTEDSFFEGYGRKLPQLAEEHGYLVAAPLGYRVDGSYGWGIGNPPTDPSTRRREEYSEADVMQVLAQVRKLYNVDPARIYLMGHSMGAIGTWKIAPKYPDIWAALGLFAGQGAPATIASAKNIPEFVVHGDADATVNVNGSRRMVEAMKALNMDVTYIEVPGGNHTGVVEPNLAAMMQFFNARRKGAAITP